jgi:hypothetical protein
MSMSLSRRTFLKTVAAALASFLLPRSLRAEGRPRFWFIHTETGAFWPVVDPVVWCLDNARQPILERASAGLLKLTPADGQRIIRLVTRRCKLNLLELRPGRVVVHHWGQQGQADLHPFFKHHGLARNDVLVTLIDRKRETSTVQTGADLLYGEQLAEEFPLRVYLEKWRQRAIEEPDDWTPAPHTCSGFAWEGIEPNCIPWCALKSAWRRTTPLICLNCDQPTILANFGHPSAGMFNRKLMFISVCPVCRRLFEDRSIGDVAKWVVKNLEAEVWPNYEMVWDRTRTWEPPDQ